MILLFYNTVIGKGYEMFWNIFKRDIKRKKTMNIIILLFILLATMFVASGINNVLTTMNGTDYYLHLAGIGDYIVITQFGDGGIPQLLIRRR